MTQTLADLVARHLFLAYALIFLVSMGEAVFVVGIFVPSTLVLLAVGALVGAGKLPFLPVLLLASAGAAAGDGLSFLIGRHYRNGIRLIWPFRRYVSLLDRGEAFFARHGGKSILFGRFVPGIKTVVPGIAGMTGMNATWFTVVNVLSAFVWAGAHLLPGMGLGQGLVWFDPRLTLMLCVALAALAVAYYAARVLYRLAAVAFEGWRTRRLNGAGDRDDLLRRPLVRLLASEDDVASRATALLLAAFAAGLFATIAADLLLNPELQIADGAVFNYLQSLRTLTGTRLMTAITMAADGFVLTGLTLTLIAALAWQKRYRIAATVTGAMVATSLFVPAVKSVIQRPRPTPLYSGAEAFSFPSGHATQSAVFLGILAVVFSASLMPRHRPTIFAAAGVGALAIAFSRLFLGAHWLSDVAAGLCFGVLTTAAFAAATWGMDRKTRAAPLAIQLGVAFCILYGYHMANSYGSWLTAYAPRPAATRLSGADWMNGGWTSIASHRVTLGGDQAGALSIQTDLPAEALTDRLAEQGWSTVPVAGLVDAVLPSAAPLGDRPASLLLHDGQRAVETFVRYGPDVRRRDVLNFWPAFAASERVDGEILVGGLSHEVLDPVVGDYATIAVSEATSSTPIPARDPSEAIGRDGSVTRPSVALWPATPSDGSVEASNGTIRRTR